MNYELLKEKIIETNYYLTDALIKGDVDEIAKRKLDLDSLIDEVLKNKKN